MTASYRRTSLAEVSAMCWMFGRELNRKTSVPVGLVGVHVNNSDIWPWSPYEAISSDCARDGFLNHTEVQSANAR